MQANTAVAAQEDAQTLIIERSNQLVTALKEQSAAIKADNQIAYKLVEDIVLPHVDFTRVARLVLGKYWRSANAEQRERFTQEFRDFLVRIYVTAMVEFSDQIVSHAQNVKYLPFRNSNPDDVSVRMLINLPDRPPLQVNYSLHYDGSGNSWKIYDLAVEGVSLATTYRSSFATQIRREGIDGLINKLAERNAEAKPAADTSNKAANTAK
jgi:phospholipid transport system substrate-binding protein